MALRQFYGNNYIPSSIFFPGKLRKDQGVAFMGRSFEIGGLKDTSHVSKEEINDFLKSCPLTKMGTTNSYFGAS